MTFALLLSGNPAGAVGGRGGGLGLAGLDAYAVEFDTWENGTDPSSNHVGVVYGGDLTEHFGTGEVPVVMDEGGVLHVRVYAEAGTFSVSLSSPDRNLSETTVMVATIPEYPGGEVFFGFTAATGGAFSRHTVDNVILQIPGEEPPEPTFLRGDVNATKVVDIADPIALLEHLFAGGPPLRCLDAADANDDGAVDISDAIFTLAYLFGMGRDVPAPYPACGLDPPGDALSCLDYPACE
jgi:hypothetical protein